MSCASSPPLLEVKVEPAPIERAIYPRPAGIAIPKVNIIVMTPERMAQWSHGDEVFYGFDEDDYLDLSQLWPV